MITNPGDIPAFIKILKKQPFHYFTGLNTLFNTLLQSPLINSVDFSHLKVTLAGGMATQQSIANDWKKLTGCTVIEVTECAPMVSVNFPFNNSIGLPLPSTDIRLVLENGLIVEN